MKVVLIADVKKVGRKGDVVEVANGYAQSVLFPKKLALPGTPENLKKAEKQVALKEDKKAFDNALLTKMLKDLDGKTISISAKANNSGTLFESIHEKHILAAVKSQHGVDLPFSVLTMKTPIKSIGAHQVELQGGREVATITLDIK